MAKCKLKFTNPTISLPNNIKSKVFPKSVGFSSLVKTGRVKILNPKEKNDAIKYILAFFCELYSFVNTLLILLNKLFSIF